MPLRQASRRFRSTLFAVVLMAFALAQTLGLVHSIVHSAFPAHATANAGGVNTGGVTLSAAPALGWLQALFVGHAGKQGCQFYDQLSHGDLLPAPIDAAVLPLPAEALGDPARPALHLAAQATGFLARGPPLTS